MPLQPIGLEKALLSLDYVVSIFLDFALVPRRKNLVPSRAVQFTTTTKIRDLLEFCVHTGYFGKTAHEAAERILAEALRRMVKEGELKQLSEQEMGHGE